MDLNRFSALRELIATSPVTSAELCGLFLPLLICVFFWSRRVLRQLNWILLVTCLATTALSIARQHWRYLPTGVIELHQFPACALALLFMPRKYRPSWQLGYCLVFSSSLATDIIAGVQFALRNHCMSVDFFCGIGGGGFGDGLFLYPALTASALWLLQLAVRSRFGQGDFRHSVRMLVGL